MNQIVTLISLYSEIIACLIAASVLSLFVGWMLSRSRAKHVLHTTNMEWEKRYQALEESHYVEVENLEEQLQNLASENRAMQATNMNLTDSLKKSDTSIQRTRAEAIELNRQHAETQERLQRVIQQKDRELLEYANSVNQSTPAMREIASTRLSSSVVTTLHSRTILMPDSEIHHADTIAINPAEIFDATVQMSAEEFIHQKLTDRDANEFDTDETMDDTADITDVLEDEYEESTVALGEEAISFAQKSSTGRLKD